MPSVYTISNWDKNIMRNIITTVAYNKPKFIEYQYRSFKKFIQNDFEYVVFNNADNPDIKKEIDDACNSINVTVKDVLHNSGGDSVRAGYSLNFAIRDTKEVFGDCNLLVIDSDIFLLGEYNLESAVNKYDFVGRYWNVEHLFYYTNHFIHLNLSKLPNIQDIDFLPVTIDDIALDCGGKLYYYFRDNPEVSHGYIKTVPRSYITHKNMEKYTNLKNNTLLMDFFRKECDIFGDNFSEVFQDVFVHLRAGSNWIGIDSTKQFDRESNIFNILK